jgi:hypothetical protein
MDFAELIDQLHKAAQELFQHASELGDSLDSPSALPRAQELLKTLCDTLEKVHGFLGEPNSPLHWLVERVSGTALADTLGRTKQFLEEHRKTLIDLKVPPKLIDQVIGNLSVQVEGAGPENLATPQGIVAKDVLAAVAECRDAVCALSRITEFAEDVLTPEVLKHVVDAVAGTALVIVDVTTAAATAPHDWTGWVLLKAIKSTASGVSRIRRAVGPLKDAVSRWTSLIKQKKLRKDPKPRLRGGKT